MIVIGLMKSLNAVKASRPVPIGRTASRRDCVRRRKCEPMPGRACVVGHNRPGPRKHATTHGLGALHLDVSELRRGEKGDKQGPAKRGENSEPRHFRCKEKNTEEKGGGVLFSFHLLLCQLRFVG